MTQDYTFTIKRIIICIFQEQSHIKAGKEKAKGNVVKGSATLVTCLPDCA